MKTRIQLALFFTGVVTITTSCGQKASEVKKKPVSLASKDISGNWTTGCIDFGEGSSGRMSLSFSSGVRSLIAEGFDDGDCSNPTFEERRDSTYTLGAAVKTPAGAREITSSTTKVTLKPLSEYYVNDYRESFGKECGVSFTKGKVVELTPAKCPGVFQSVYTIYKLDESGLVPGACDEDESENDCSEAGKRANKLDTDLRFVRTGSTSSR